MKFLDAISAQQFVLEIGQNSLLESVGVNFQPTDEMVELFIKKRKKEIGKIVDFRKSQDSKENWRKNRHKIGSGIRKFHRSTTGKRMHRNLGRFLATRESKDSDVFEALTAISSAKSHAYLSMEYYMPFSEELEYRMFLLHMQPVLTSVESKLFSGTPEAITEEEEDLLIRLCETNALIGSYAEKSGKSRGEVERLWDKAKARVKTEYGLDDDSDRFYALTNGIVKKMLGMKESTEMAS